MRVLVTGASGFIGRPLVEMLRRQHEVWEVARSKTGERSVEWDLSEPLKKGALPARLDSVVHLAQSRDYRRFPERAVAIARVNVEATLELLDRARETGVKTFVFASSGGVYGGATRPIKEDARVTGPDFYLSTKLAGEALVHGYRSEFDVEILRLFFVYGPGQSPDRFFAKLVRTVLSGDPVVLYGPDGIRLNPIHVSDVAAAMSAALGLAGSQVVNIAGPEVITLRSLAELIGSHVGRAPVFEERPADPERDLVADIGLMRRLLLAPSQRLADRVGEVCEEVMAATR